MELTFTVMSVDDCPDDVSRLREALRELPFVRYDGNAPTLAKARELLQQRRPDLLFLDIELPDGSGLDAMQELRTMADWPMQVVFYTIHDSYVIEALRNAAYDYLVKPLRRDELRMMLSRFERDFRKNIAPSASTFNKPEGAENGIYMVNTEAGYQQIKMADVVYLEHIPKSKYWQLYMSDGTSQTLRKETSGAMILSMYSRFAQVNQSQIINLQYLSILRRDSCTLLPPFDGVEIAVSRSFLTALQSRMFFI